MAQTRFKFTNVLHPNEVKAFEALFISHCNHNAECGSWSWSQSNDGREKTTVEGKMWFKVERSLRDVKQWLVSIFGNTLCEHLSVEMVNGHEIDPTGFYKPPPDFLKCKLYKKYGWKI